MRSRKLTMRLNKIAGNFILLTISSLFSLMIGEIAIRYIAPQSLIKYCYQYDPEVALSGIPNCSFIDNWDESITPYETRFNNMGFRMNDDILPEDDELIASIGDSFTYGWGVELKDAFWGIFNKQLSTLAPSKKWVNTGFPSYSTGHCLKTLERLDDKNHVSKAIYFMFYNDIFDNVRSDKNYICYSYKTNEAGEVQLEDVTKDRVNQKPSFFKQTLRWLYKRSHLVILLRKSMPDFKNGGFHSGPLVEEVLADEQVQTMLNVSFTHLDNLVETCKQRNIDLQIIWIPCWKELDLENNFEWENHFPLQGFKDTMAASYPFFDPTVNLNELLKDEQGKLSDYYYKEGHFNKKGNILFHQSIEKVVLDFVEGE